MGVNREIIVNGVTYNSIKECAEFLGIKPCSLNNRLRRGWSTEDLDLPSQTKLLPVTVNNMNFRSLTAAADYYGIYVATVHRRVVKGWSIEQALEIEPPPYDTNCENHVYRIRNIKNGKIYVGVTNDIRRRKTQHLIAMRTGSNSKLYVAMRKYGLKNFKFKVLKTVRSKMKLRELERKYIEKYNCVSKGYNTHTHGGPYGKYSTYEFTIKGKKFNDMHIAASHFGIAVSTAYAWASKDMKNVPKKYSKIH